ncbi:type VI secretion system protein ImpA [Afifella marina DSM 2698]|uniref:Type VI secretion system protein ImpA n=1 Tax=Afifella marina DSM 2698 TaxID=1120955 RepID=A0A1G5MPM2_AFIMA|nr:type VI secretion system protein ImpA [Afifella marina DSM 2698]
MHLDIPAITATFDSRTPCGGNPRSSPETRELYYRIKDSRNAARSEERSIAPGEPIRLSQKWREVHELANDILINRAKDLEILAWLAEAQLRLEGFAGLRDVFTAMTALVTDQWDHLHSVGDGDLEDKVAPLAGLNGIGGEGSLIQPVRLTPLVPGAHFGEHSLWDYQLSQRDDNADRKEALEEAVSEAGTGAMATRHQEAMECLTAFNELVAVVDERCGAGAPASSNTRTVLAEAAAAIRVLANLKDDSAAAADETGARPFSKAKEEISQRTPGNGADETEGAVELSAPRIGSLVIGSRDDAFEALGLIARYFRRSEPHSPIAASIETLVRRGRMDFVDLLGELLPDPATRKQVLTAAGIQPPKAGAENGEAAS